MSNPKPNANVPQIAQPMADVRALAMVAQSLKQGMDSLGGHRGNPLDRAITFNDLGLGFNLNDGKVNVSNTTTIISDGGGGTAAPTTVVAGAGLTGGTITTRGTIALAQIAAHSLSGNAGTVSAVPTAVAVGSGLSLGATGTLSNSGVLAVNVGTAALTGGITLIAGSGVTLTPSGSVVTVSAAGGGSGVTAYFNGNNNLVATGTFVGTPTADSMSLTIPASSTVRKIAVSASMTFAGSHGIRAVIQLDGVTVFPVQNSSGLPWMASNDGFASVMANIANVVVTVPGDNHTHTITLAMNAAGSLASINLLDRWITGIVVG